MQLTLRIDADLAAELKRVAGRRGQSVNAFAAAVLGAAVDPELAGGDAERIRERLARAGLLDAAPSEVGAEPVDPTALHAARHAAGQGTPLSELVGEDRR